MGTFVSLLTEVGPSLLFSSASAARRPAVGNPDLSRDTRLLSAPNPLLRRTPSGEDQEPRKLILRQNMEDFSLSMSSDSFNEEWLDLQDILTKDREKDLEEKNLGDLDFAGLYSIGTGHKGFERQPSYLEIISDIESKDPFGTFNESTMFFNNYNNNVSSKENNVVTVKQERTSSLRSSWRTRSRSQGSRWTPPSPSKRQRRRRGRAMTVMRTTFLNTQNPQRGRERRRF